MDSFLSFENLDIYLFLHSFLLICFLFLKDGWTPLHFACMKEKIEVVECILKRNVDVNVTTTQKTSSNGKVCFKNFNFWGKFAHQFFFSFRKLDRNAPLFTLLVVLGKQRSANFCWTKKNYSMMPKMRFEKCIELIHL